MYKRAFLPAPAFTGLIRPALDADMSCPDCDACRACTIAFLQHFVDAFVGIGLALLQFCTSLTGAVLAAVVLIGAAFALLHY